CRTPGTAPPDPVSRRDSQAALSLERCDHGEHQTSQELPLRREAKSGWFLRVLGFRRADRKEIPTLVSTSPVADGAANVRGAVAASFDLTNPKMMEERFREHAQLLELAAEAIMVSDHRGIVRFWTQAPRPSTAGRAAK